MSHPPQHSQQKVLIIGAGLGGLALAQILQHHSIPFEIFERDTHISSRKQGWGTALAECLPVLKALLPPETASRLHHQSVNANTGDVDDFGFVNAISGALVGKAGGAREGEKGYILRASRQGLRRFLWAENGIPVQVGKCFTRYSLDSEYSVTAHFDDGTSATGTLLVGADGVHSRTLDQLIGSENHKPVLSCHVPIFGEVQLPRETYEPLRKWGTAVILAGAKGIRFQLGMLGRRADGSFQRWFWVLMPKRKDPRELSEWVQRASREEVFDFVTELTKDWDEMFRSVFRMTGPQGLAQPQPKFVEFLPPETLSDGRVIVLGDGSCTRHGANTAILDACDLATALISVHRERSDFAGIVEGYNAVMIPRGREKVLSSRAAGADDEDPVAKWSSMFKRY